MILMIVFLFNFLWLLIALAIIQTMQFDLSPFIIYDLSKKELLPILVWVFNLSFSVIGIIQIIITWKIN